MRATRSQQASKLAAARAKEATVRLCGRAGECSGRARLQNGKIVARQSERRASLPFAACAHFKPESQPASHSAGQGAQSKSGHISGRLTQARARVSWIADSPRERLARPFKAKRKSGATFSLAREARPRATCPRDSSSTES